MTGFAPRRSTRALAAALLLALSAATLAAPYTYHGELMDGDAPAEGGFDVRVRAFATPDAKTALGHATELPAVAVKQGRFALQVDLPDNPRGELYVEVAIRKAGTQDAYEILGTPQAVTKAAVGCWAVDGNSGLPPNSFLGIAENVATPLVLRARDSAVATFSPDGTAASYGDAPRVALGSSANQATGLGATVAGGGATLDGPSACGTCGNVASNDFATVGGGFRNRASGTLGTVAGGSTNTASGAQALVAGGQQNTASGLNSAIGGGQTNLASGDDSVVAGGEENVAGGIGGFVGGGQTNIASGSYSSTLGGFQNCAGGDRSVAMGTLAKVRSGTDVGDLGCGAVTSGDANGDEGSFVWADADGGFNEFQTTGPNQFLVRAQGGVGINAAPLAENVELTITSDVDDSDTANLWLKQRAAGNNGMLISSNGNALLIDHFNGTTQARRAEFNADGSVEIRSNITAANTGVVMAANGGSWSSLSDRRLKTAIVAVDPLAILDRLLAMPMSTWSYTAQGEGIRHIGPMAQDFAAAFGVGENDTTISTIDADGVALAAIQGLNARLTAENAQLRARLDALEAKLEAMQ